MAKEAQEFPEVVNDYPPERHAHDAMVSINEVLKESRTLQLSAMDEVHLKHTLRTLEAIENTSADNEARSTPLASPKIVNLLSGISQSCIGAIAMGYPLDPEVIGNDIYLATGLTSPELLELSKGLNDE